MFSSSYSGNPDPLSHCKPNPGGPQVQNSFFDITITITITILQCRTCTDTPPLRDNKNDNSTITRVLCDAGFDGGLQQTFHMEVVMSIMI